MASLLLALFLAGDARADASCIARDGQPVFATMTLVHVGHDVSYVRGRAHRLAFEAELRSRYGDDAAGAFRRWRAARRATNVFAVASLAGLAGAFSGTPALVLVFPAATGGAGLLAGMHQEAMVTAICARKGIIEA